MVWPRFIPPPNDEHLPPPEWAEQVLRAWWALEYFWKPSRRWTRIYGAKHIQYGTAGYVSAAAFAAAAGMAGHPVSLRGKGQWYVRARPVRGRCGVLRGNGPATDDGRCGRTVYQLPEKVAGLPVQRCRLHRRLKYQSLAPSALEQAKLQDAHRLAIPQLALETPQYRESRVA